MPKKIWVSRNLCVNCRMCEVACSYAKEGVFGGNVARIRVNRKERGIDRPDICRQCLSPPCVSACPENVITRDKVTGIVSISEEKCLGCYECVSACPFGAIQIEVNTQKIIKCDLCVGNPECVKWCPTGAIRFLDIAALNVMGHAK